MEAIFYTWILSLFYPGEKLYWRGSACHDWLEEARLSLADNAQPSAPTPQGNRDIASLIKLCREWENKAGFIVFNSMKFNMDLALRCNQ